jgi:hypothetical protein
MSSYKHILLAVDFYENCSAVNQRAKDLASRETGFITPSQTFDIAIIFERSPKQQAYFWLYSAA